MADRSVSVALVAKVQGFTAGIATARKATQEFSSDLDKMAKNHKEKFNSLTSAAGGFSLALGGVAAAVVGVSYQFDKQMSAVASVANATRGELDQLRAAALKAGKDTAYSATEAAQAEEELAKAGISTQAILGGALTGTLSLAAAAGEDLAAAATDAAQAMNIFGLAGKDVGHIADVLAGGANTSATDVHQLALSLAQGGQVAHSFGLTLEDTTGTFAAFAQAGMIGSDAGTSLKTMLQALANPSKQSADLMRQLGIKVYDTSGQFIGITKLAQLLQDKLGGLTQAQRNQALAQIFGSDATRAANVLYTQGAKGLQGYIDGVNQVGAAADAAAKRQDNLAGDVEKLKGSLESLALSSGGGASDGLRKLTQAANGAVDSLAAMPPWLSQTLVLTSGLAGGSLALAVGMVKARQKINEIRDAMTEMGPAGAKAAGALGTVASGAARLTVLLAALQAASAALGSNASTAIPQTTKDLKAFADSGDKAGASVKHLSYDLGTLGSGAMAKFGNGLAGAIEGLTGTGAVFDESLQHAKERITSIDQAMAALVAAGKADEAGKDFDALAAEAKKAGISLDDLKAGLPGYEAAISGAGAAQIKAIQATQDSKGALDALNGSLTAAIDKYGSFKDAVDGINGKQESTLKATLDARDAVDALSESLKKNGKNFNDSTAGGRENLRAVLALADAASAAADAVYQQTGSVADAKRVYDTYIETIRRLLHNLGLTDDQIQTLISSFAAMPKNITASVSVNGITKAIADGQALQRIYSDVNGRHVQITVDERRTGKSNTPIAQRRGGVHYAASGLVSLGQAGVYDNGPVYGFAEPQTKGEAFVPRSGDYARSTGIIDTAARWYGGRFVPGGGGGGYSGGGGTLTVVLTGGDAATRAHIAGLRAYVQGSYGGNVQLALGQ
jgi:TP901 family phage tail tape measure protein